MPLTTMQDSLMTSEPAKPQAEITHMPRPSTNGRLRVLTIPELGPPPTESNTYDVTVMFGTPGREVYLVDAPISAVPETTGTLLKIPVSLTSFVVMLSGTIGGKPYAIEFFTDSSGY